MYIVYMYMYVPSFQCVFIYPLFLPYFCLLAFLSLVFWGIHYCLSYPLRVFITFPLVLFSVSLIFHFCNIKIVLYSIISLKSYNSCHFVCDYPLGHNGNKWFFAFLCHHVIFNMYIGISVYLYWFTKISIPYHTIARWSFLMGSTF